MQPIDQPLQVMWLRFAVQQGVHQSAEPHTILGRLDESGLVGGILAAVAEDQQLPLVVRQAVHEHPRNVRERRRVPQADRRQDIGAAVPAGADRATGSPSLVQEHRPEQVLGTWEALFPGVPEPEARGVQVAVEQAQLGRLGFRLGPIVVRFCCCGFVVLLLRPKGVNVGIDLDSGFGRVVEEERILGRPPPGPGLKGLVFVRLNGDEEVPAAGAAQGQR